LGGINASYLLKLASSKKVRYVANMKTPGVFVIGFLAAVCVGHAQSQNADLTTQQQPAATAAKSGGTGTMEIRKVAPQTIRRDQGVAKGPVAHILKKGNPLQLINPFAPAEYGGMSYPTLSRSHHNEREGAPGLVLISVGR
jgi:hypothetical protein